ncbi:hypothetical protein BDF19DRAFT_388894 [Syncephalis fuscata]|nr:hypothetical protein BDF19DRAFT_388894 [Syncephalis fuscata]
MAEVLEANHAAPLETESIHPVAIENVSPPANENDNNDVVAEEEEEEEEEAPDPDTMEYWQERCSICFDKKLEFCLQPCRDQFCFECFQRYIAEVVNNSWGLSVTEVKCPVCMNEVAQEEWKQYATEEVVSRYDEYNQPYRPFSRHCGDCSEEISAIQPPDTDMDLEERVK